MHERAVKKELKKRIFENQLAIQKKQKEAREKQIHENRIQQEEFRLELIEIEKIRAKEAAIAESNRILNRDSDSQKEPYVYSVGRHANEALAYRYGIANEVSKSNRNYNSEIDDNGLSSVPATTIKIKKIRKIKDDVYEVLLSDFRDRPAKAVIEVGTEYVKTFLPFDERWHEEFADFELTMKGNTTFTLKELAKYHVEQLIRRKNKASE